MKGGIKMISEKDKTIFRHLRKNARINLTDIAKITKIPASTIYDRVKANEKIIVKKHTTLLDFAKLGYHAKAMIALKVAEEDKDRLFDFLNQHNNVNSLYRINYGFHYLAEVVFQNVLQVEDFMHMLGKNFRIKEKHIFNLIDDIKREEFML
jgi:DNA-binding Lrp family transcriptional regulator